MSRCRQVACLLLLLTLGTISIAQVKKPDGQVQPKPTPRKMLGAEARPAEMTLGEARSILIGKKVVIRGRVSQLRYMKGLSDWMPATEQNGKYEHGRLLDGYLPESYLGNEATIVTIQLNERKSVGRANAFGEAVSEDSLRNPYVDVVVKFHDGKLAITTKFLSALFMGTTDGKLLQLLSESNDRASQINSQIPSIIDKTVYAVRYTKLYSTTATVAEMLDPVDREGRRIREHPRLQPLTIATAKYDQGSDFLILKLKDSMGNEYLTLSRCERRERDARGFLEVAVGSFPASLIASVGELTPREIASIKQGEIFRGMSRLALYYALGFQDKENDWGRGGKQLVYFGGSLFVYLTSADRVQDWQNLEK